MRSVISKVWLLLIFFFAVSLPAVAQQYRIDAWTADNGLPQNPVNRVLQTRDGFIWIATFAGLARFDGASFEVFNPGTTPELRSSRFTDLFEDREGNLWASTEGQGVARYKDGVFHVYAEAADGLVDNSARFFFYDSQGRLLLDSKKGVVEWKDGKFVPFTEYTPSDSRPEMWSLFRMPSGAIWYLDKAGAHKFENARVTKDVPLKDDVKWVFEDREGRLWLEYDRNGDRFLMLYADGKFIPFSAADGIPKFRTTTFSEDRNGIVWLGLSGNGGMLRFKDGRFTRYSTADGLPSNNVGRMFQDREGTLWAPTDGGLVRWTERVVTPYSAVDGLSADNIYPIYEDRSRNVWIGGWLGLTQYKDGVFRSVGDRYGVGGKNVMALFEDRDRNFWIGLWGFGGVVRVKDGIVDNFELRSPAGDVVRAIAQDRAGNIWLGGNQGLTRYANGVFQRITRQDGFSGGLVLSIRSGTGGNLWIGTDVGLSEYRDGKFTNYGAAQGLTGNLVRSIYEDADGTLWVGTYDSGLFRFKNGKFFRYTKREGLADNGAFQILEDGRGNFWISNNAGIYRVARTDLENVAAGRTQTVLSIPYSKRDGMITAECNGGAQPAGIRASDGRLWFPTQKGVVVVDADHLPLNPLPPPVTITGLTVDRQPVPLNGRIEIRPDVSAFEINYAGLTYIQPELTHFRYKLMDLDTNWVDAGNRRTAYFSHVPYGAYRFVVTAANSDGLWNETGASVPVFIVPPFWRTRWFEAAAALSIVVSMVVLYSRRIQALQRIQALHEAFSRQLIDSQENERKRIAAELHDSLGQSLVLIKNWALMGIKAAPDEGAKTRWSDVSTAAAGALDEVREIAYNLGPYQLDRLGLTQTILEMLERVSTASGISFTAEVTEVDGVLPKEVEIALYRVIQESVSNIVKHSHATKAVVALELESERLVLTVRDDGKGFYRESPTSSAPGKQGFGLVGLAERSRLLGGTCSIQSSPGAGTKVEVRIPLKNGNGKYSSNRTG